MLQSVKCENLSCSRSLSSWTWWDVLPWCGHLALEPRLPLCARLSSAVQEFLSARAKAPAMLTVGWLGSFFGPSPLGALPWSCH